VARALDATESALLRLLLVAPSEQVRVREELAPELISSTPARELWRAMLADRERDPDDAFQRDRFLESLDPTLGALARTLYARTDPVPGGDDLEYAVEDCLRTLKRRRIDERLDYLRAELVEAEATTDDARAETLRRDISAQVANRFELDRQPTGLLHRTKPDARTPAHAGGIA
jgi:hypothetical protein